MDFGIYLNVCVQFITFGDLLSSMIERARSYSIALPYTSLFFLIQETFVRLTEIP